MEKVFLGDEFMNNFQRDMQINNLVTQWLDTYLYGPKGFKISRTDDLSSQHEGSDVIVTTPNGNRLVIDEKSSTQYIAYDDEMALPTFAFEIGYLVNGRFKEGWAIREDKYRQTTHYLLSWIKAKQKKIAQVDDILAMHSLLLSKAKIHEIIHHIYVSILSAYNIDINASDAAYQLYQIAQSCDKNNRMFWKNDFVYNGETYKYKLFYTDKSYIPEHPLNILLYRKGDGQILRKIADKEFLTEVK